MDPSAYSSTMAYYSKCPSNDGFHAAEDRYLPDLQGVRLTERSTWKSISIGILMVTASTAGFILGRRWPTRDIDHLKALTTWSPMHDSLPLLLHQDRINGSFWSDNPSLWMAEPSPVSNMLWEEHLSSRPMLMPIADLAKMGQDTTYVMRWADDPTQTLVGNHAHHLLHCLEMVRKAIWSDYDWPQAHLNPNYRHHQAHCLDILRQDLMCRVPRDVIPYIWTDAEEQPTPDFNLTQKCGQWDAMSTWWRERQITEQQMERIRWIRPEQRRWHAPESWKKASAALEELCLRPNVSCTDPDGKPLQFGPAPIVQD